MRDARCIHGRPAVVEYTSKGATVIGTSKLNPLPEELEAAYNEFLKVAQQVGKDAASLGWTPKIGGTGYLDIFEGLPKEAVVVGMDEWGRHVVYLRGYQVVEGEVRKLTVSVSRRYEKDTGPVVVAGSSIRGGERAGPCFGAPLGVTEIELLTRLLKEKAVEFEVTSYEGNTLKRRLSF
jgi:hypothetical protein